MTNEMIHEVFADTVADFAHRCAIADYIDADAIAKAYLKFGPRKFFALYRELEKVDMNTSCAGRAAWDRRILELDAVKNQREEYERNKVWRQTP